MIKALLRMLESFERWVVVLLIVLMVLAVSLSALDLAHLLFKDIWESPNHLLDVSQLLDTFGLFLLVILGLELLETIKAYLNEHAIHVEIVLIVALIAIARKVIILEMKTTEAISIFAIGFLVLTLAIGYFLISRIDQDRLRKP